MKIKTSELSGAALDWAYLFALYGDGPDWRLDGERGFGIVTTVMVQTGLDSYGDHEEFQEFRPRDLCGEEHVRRIVASKLGYEVDVPEGLV